MFTHPSRSLNSGVASLPWAQACTAKHLDMQTASTSISERVSRSQELGEFHRGTVIGCHLCNKTRHEISSLLNIPQSAVSGFIKKKRGSEWERERLSYKEVDRPEITGQRMQRCIVSRGWPLVSMATKPYITKCNAKGQMQRVKHLEQQRCVLWSDESNFSIWQSDGRVWVWWLPGQQYFSHCICCGNSLGMAPSCSNMTAHQCTKQGP